MNNTSVCGIGAIGDGQIYFYGSQINGRYGAFSAFGSTLVPGYRFQISRNVGADASGREGSLKPFAKLIEILADMFSSADLYRMLSAGGF